MFGIYDVVKIVGVSNDEQKMFIGAEGLIIERDEDWEYQNNIIFFDKYLRELNEKNGEYLWKDYQVEGV